MVRSHHSSLFYYLYQSSAFNTKIVCYGVIDITPINEIFSCKFLLRIRQRSDTCS